MAQKIRVFDGLESRLGAAAWGAHFQVAGRVSSTNVGEMIGAVVSDLAQAPPLTAVCDYRGADMGATARRLVIAHRQTGTKASWPTALVVQRDQLEVWRQYEWLQAQDGILKAVFTDLGPAQRWARDMAALQAAQARFRLRE